MSASIASFLLWGLAGLATIVAVGLYFAGLPSGLVIIGTFAGLCAWLARLAAKQAKKEGF